MWHFEDFKGKDMLLLSGHPEAIEQLAVTLEVFAASSDTALALEDRLPIVGFGQLFVLKEAVAVTGLFRWLVPTSMLPTVIAQVRAVAAHAPAHQYFDLLETPTTLMISSGEYSPEWFQAHA